MQRLLLSWSCVTRDGGAARSMGMRRSAAGMDGPQLIVSHRMPAGGIIGRAFNFGDAALWHWHFGAGLCLLKD